VWGQCQANLPLLLRIMFSRGSSTSLHLVCFATTMQTVLAAAEVDFTQYVNVL
jgi:hypothetical protein